MTVVEKFLFDRIFDELEPIQVPKPSDVEMEDDSLLLPEPEEEIPTFSEEDVARARQEGFDAGKEEAKAEALNGIEMKIADSLDVVGNRLNELFQIQAQSSDQISEDAARLALAVSRKMFPALNERGALGEVTAVVEEVLQRLIQEPRVIIKVAGEMSQQINERVDNYLRDKGLDNNISVTGDDAMSPGDVAIEWSDGSANRDTAALIEEIDEIMAHNLGSTGDGETGAVEIPSDENIPNEVLADENTVEEIVPEDESAPSIEEEREKTDISDQNETESSSLAGDNEQEGEDQE